VNYLISIIIFISTFGSFHTLHEFHVSKCLVEFKAEKEEIQISMNIFIDDLEIALKNMGIDSLYIGTEKESTVADEYIQKYLERTFMVGVNDSEKSTWLYIGKEVSEDLTSVWCYLLIEVKDEIDQLYIKNSILLETYDDQKNITSIIGPKKVKTSFMGTKGDDEKTISY